MTPLFSSLTVSVLALTASAALAHPLPPEITARFDASSTPATGELSLAEVRAATERFRDVVVALAEGYMREPTNMCDTAEMMGQPGALGGKRENEHAPVPNPCQTSTPKKSALRMPGRIFLLNGVIDGRVSDHFRRRSAVAIRVGVTQRLRRDHTGPATQTAASSGSR